MAMGSALRLTAWTSNEAVAQAAFNDVFAEFGRLEQLISTWTAASDVVRINQSAGVRPSSRVPKSATCSRLRDR